MRIHTNEGARVIISALNRAIAEGHVTPDVEFVKFEQHGSRSRLKSFEVQLGTFDKHSGPTNSRHYKNSGTHGADSVWAATYDEWGFFLANLFDADPIAIAGQYGGRMHFHGLTASKYHADNNVRI